MGRTWRVSPPRRSWPGIAGAALLIASGSVHLDLYLTGYRSIPTIGWLFLLQVIAAYLLAAAIAVTGNPVAAAGGAALALGTLGGYLLSLRVGLFGFTEVRTTAGIVAGVIEVAAFAALAAAAGLPRRILPALAAACIVAFGLLAADVAMPAAQAGAAATAGTQVLKIGRADGTAVLTDSKGFTLYWFAPDTATRSACTGTCAAYWPPLLGSPSAGPGVSGRLGTIRRPDGSVQATFDGHPLYTYVGDTAPGLASGNGLNLNGGLWHDIPVPSAR
jgi:predicted lipoprotein with Yx(FWY)xxD motif